MKYLSLKDCEIVFEEIERIEYDEDLIHRPKYKNEAVGLKKLRSVLALIKAPYYRGFYEKAAYLFVSINKGHFFSNGNKRLALVMLVMFIKKNEYIFKNISPEKYLFFLFQYFPKAELEADLQKINTVVGFAFYNLNKLIASSRSKKFDELKEITKQLLKLSLTKQK